MPIVRFTLFALVVYVTPVFSQPAILTYHYDSARTGTNVNETILNPSNVNTTSFGLLHNVPVDGWVFAEPLFIGGLTVNGSVHNTVFVATENNSVYAFDSDSGAQLWKVNFNYGPAGTTVTSIPAKLVISKILGPKVGITGTPVIDPAAKMLYVVTAALVTTSKSSFPVQYLRGVNITTGVETFTPVKITASVPGTCGSVNGANVEFNPLRQNQRPALLLLNGVVYITWASHGDNDPWNGWVIGYNVSTGQQVAVLNTSANDPTGQCRGGIWMSGGGPASDLSGNIYVLTGNGPFDVDKGGSSYGDSLLKLTPDSTGAVSITDYFTPSNQALLNTDDLDFAGSGQAVLLPNEPGGHPHEMIAAGKVGSIYLLDRDNLGKYSPNADQVIQVVQRAIGDGQSAFPPPVIYRNVIYFAASSDTVKAFTLTNGMLSTAPTATSTVTFGYLGAGLFISSQTDGSNEIVWALEGASIPGALHAFNASNLVELYNSNMAAGGADVPGQAIHFSIPSVADGKVFVGTQNSLAIYGLK